MVDTIFIHWAVSYREGTEGIHLPPQKLVAHHYREHTASLDVPPWNSPYDTTDTSLQKDAAALEAALTKRRGKPAAAYLKNVSSVTKAALLDWPEDDFEIELSKKFAPWIQRLTESSEVLRIEPPRRLIDMAGVHARGPEAKMS